MPYYCEILRVSARTRFGVTTKTADRLFGRVKKAWRRRGENIYWSYSGMTVLNLEKRRPCPAFTFTLNQIVKKKKLVDFPVQLVL